MTHASSLAAFVGFALLLPATASAQWPTRLVAEVGGTVQVVGGSGTVASLNLPFDDGSGGVGFTGSLVIADSTEGFVFHDDAVVWRNDAAPGGTRLEGREVWMGVGSAGQFLYSPSVNDADGLWSDLGLLARRGDPAPGLPGQFLSFTSRPGLRPDGGAHWMAGLATSPSGGTTARAFYASPDRTAASASVVLAEGQLVDGVAVTGLDFSYGVSDSGGHRMFIVTRNTGSVATDGAVVLDGAVIAQEGQPVATGSPELWGSFDLVRVNDTGHYLISGDTGGPTATDEFVAYDGVIALREGSTVDGVVLGAEVRGIGLRNDGVAVWAWTTEAGAADEALFAGHAADLGGTSRLVLRTGQGLDTNGDGAADYTVDDFEFSNTDGHAALDMGGEDVVYVRLSIVPVAGGDARDAIVGVDLSTLTPSEPGTPGAGAILEVAPNPFRGGAQVTLVPRDGGPVTVDVLDLLGRRVATLHDGPLARATEHRFTLQGATLPAGLYVVRASGAGWAAARRIVRMD